MHVCSVASIVSDSFATPRTTARQAPLSMGFSRQEYGSGLSCPPQGIFPTQNDTCVSCIPCSAGGLFNIVIFVQLLSCVRLFLTLWTAACQASLSITISKSLLKLMSIESVMPSNHLILCRPLLLPPSLFHSIRVFCNESVLRIRGPKYWSFSFSISPSNEYSGLISCRIYWFGLPAVQGTL